VIQHDPEELSTAREMQQALLPHEYPSFPDGIGRNKSAVRFAHYFEPNGQVGGDLFDIFPLGESRVGVFICDVMGHGVRAALGTGIILGLLRQLSEETRDPAHMLTRLNHRLSEILAHLPEEIFTTAFFMVLDAEDGSITYSNAGHPPPLVLKKTERKAEWLSNKSTQSGTALTFLPDSLYENVSYTLNEGDRILLYTDGITEVHDTEREDFGEDGLLDYAAKNISLSPEAFMENLIGELKTFSGQQIFPDDACMVSVELDHYMK